MDAFILPLFPWLTQLQLLFVFKQLNQLPCELGLGPGFTRLLPDPLTGLLNFQPLFLLLLLHSCKTFLPHKTTSPNILRLTPPPLSPLITRLSSHFILHLFYSALLPLLYHPRETSLQSLPRAERGLLALQCLNFSGRLDVVIGTCLRPLTQPQVPYFTHLEKRYSVRTRRSRRLPSRNADTPASYVGTLHEINSDESTVSLENVRSFGTEGRKGSPEEEISPSDQVYEYIVFRGSDVKDLRIEDHPSAKENKPPAVPDDPAIVGVSTPVV